MQKLNNQIILPITITLGLGAYTTKLWIGSEQIEINVLLDTGSSTLAIDLKKYQPESDQTLKTSTYAQDVVYGSGGWAGPVIHTQIGLDHHQKFVLNDAPLAITANSQQQNFQFADGIWGLAYHHLNKAYDVSTYLGQQQPPVHSTYPWPFDNQETTSSISAFKKYLRQFPEQDITPLFTAFEENHITPNLFTLVTHRSIEYVPRPDMNLTELAQEEFNQGQFIIGAQVDDRVKQTIKVVHDAYYNTHLIACTVEGFNACKSPPLDKKHINSFFSNAIIDSGCSFLVLQKKLYTYVIDCFKQINSQFIPTIQQATTAYENDKTYLNPDLNLADWPILTLTFSGKDDENVELEIAPEYYWQVHAKSPNNWMFMILNQLPQWPDQTLCGLPLINSYVCTFDRSNQSTGLIHWIKKS